MWLATCWLGETENANGQSVIYLSLFALAPAGHRLLFLTRRTMAGRLEHCVAPLLIFIVSSQVSSTRRSCRRRRRRRAAAAAAAGRRRYDARPSAGPGRAGPVAARLADSTRARRRRPGPGRTDDTDKRCRRRNCVNVRREPRRARAGGRSRLRCAVMQAHRGVIQFVSAARAASE